MNGLTERTKSLSTCEWKFAIKDKFDPQFYMFFRTNALEHPIPDTQTPCFTLNCDPKISCKKEKGETRVKYEILN